MSESGSMVKVITLRFLFAALLILSATWIFFGIGSLGRFDWRVNNAYESDYASRRFIWEKLIEKNSQCHIPILDPFNKELVEITSDIYNSQDCSNVSTYFRAGYNASDHPQLVRKSSFPLGQLVCCWNNLKFMKQQPFIVSNGNQLCRPIPENDTQIPLPSGTQFVTIKCMKPFSNLSSSLNQTQDILDTSKTIMHKELIFFVSPPNPSSKASSITKKDHLNIILFGLDGVSRMNFIRLMRNSYRLLSTKLKPIELHGYNSLASSTLINSLGFLTGLNLSTIRKTCWNTSISNFDSCPWIWNNYSEKGYTTLFAEDYNSVFSYYLGGFQKQPTDYYLFPFGQWMDSFSECFGNKTSLLNFIERYAKVATSKLKNVPSFQMYWCGRTYTSPADPIYIDEPLEKLLTFWKYSGILNKSAVVILSDHGYKMGPILETKQGLLENQMPFAFLLFPEWFQTKYKEAYKNLVDNQWRLTTPFDLHEMLVDLLNLEDNLSGDNLQRRVESKPSPAKGIATARSLFLPIPKDRDCQAAGVDEMWCVCDNYQRFEFDRPFGWIWYNIPPKDRNLVLQMGNEVVKHLNGMMAPHRNSCMEYFLWKVLEVEKRDELIEGKAAYRLIIQVKPKGAIFQVVLFHDEEADKFLMSPEIFRVNEFAAICLNQYEFWHLCSCSDSAENSYK